MKQTYFAKIYVIGFAIIMFSNFINAQISGIDYQLEYDNELCRYNCNLVITEGSATTIVRRVQFNSQITIVLPTGSIFKIVEHFMPLQNNQNYTGTVPLNWLVGNSIIAHSLAPTEDFYGIIPTLSPTSLYNDLEEGDIVKLFSFTVKNTNTCVEGVRLFENGIDPGNLNGGDFSNNMSIGGINQMYNNNLETLPSIMDVSEEVIIEDDRLEIILTYDTTGCKRPVSFQWFGSNGFSSTAQNIYIEPYVEDTSVIYEVIITDNIGCEHNLLIDIGGNSYAGEDEEVCAGNSVALIGTPPNGIWRTSPNNDDGVVLTTLPSGKATVNFDYGISGVHSLLYKRNGVLDQIDVNVIAKPNIFIEGPENICVGETTQLSPSIGGIWESTNESIATISSSGLVTGVAKGICESNFIFTESVSGCSSVLDELLIIDDCLAVKDELDLHSIFLFPNPGTDLIQLKGIDLDENMSIFIFSNVGESMKIDFEQTNNNITINTKDLKSGIYFVEIITANKTVVKKLQIMR